MNPSHRRYLVNELIRGISDIGPLFESFGQKIADYLVTEDLTHRGLNANGLPRRRCPSPESGPAYRPECR
jgi:hypothetical protein